MRERKGRQAFALVWGTEGRQGWGMTFWEMVAAYYGSVSLITLVMYAWDKRASKRPGARRVRERTLHLMAVGGGFLGALVGMFLLRHKTKHASFVIVTVLALAAHAGAWAWWFNR